MWVFVAQKDNSRDYNDGEFFCESYATDEELVSIWAEYLAKDLAGSVYQYNFDYHIFKDGYRVWNETYSCFNGLSGSNANTKEIDTLHEIATGLARKLYKERKAEEQRQKDELEKQRKKNRIQRIKNELAKLEAEENGNA